MEETCATLCFCLLLVRGVLASADVTGWAGGAVTLPCTYPADDWVTTMCWGRGSCPNSWCNEEIIRTDGHKVTKRKSDRYQLLGNIERRNVSLTIRNLAKEDAGVYCCRVEIHGWFNDQTHETQVTVHEAPSHTGATDVDDTTNAYVPDRIPNTSNRTEVGERREDFTEEGGSFNPIIIVVVVLIIALVLLSGLLFVWKYYRKRNKNKLSDITVLTLEGLQGAQNQAEQNIYE
ncbi:hepatitis A virus cellular receptor 1 homolog isoform X2 [Hyperolius riggenbachi]|uniref:hepatitis A virus cellular receptor 1 homolog isoform X2 n=1 Tax=Hyperolius riggenbachi TaxID=752182 RepID=UPI0035A3A07E